MKKIFSAILLFTILVIASLPVFAQPFQTPPVPAPPVPTPPTDGEPHDPPPIDVPPVIPPITPGGYGRLVFVHYIRPPWAGPPDEEEEPKDYDYYELIGPKWEALSVSYVINPTGAPAESADELKLAFEAWDDATSTDLFNDMVEIDYAAEPSLDLPDRENVLCWRKIAPPKIVAMTVIWYLDNDLSEDPSIGDETIDCDIVFNSFQKWGIDLDGEGDIYEIKEFDVRNVATHEAGHVVGLDDLPEEVYSEITMYAYTKKGETKKISLAIGDEKGCQDLYGK